MSPSCRFIAGCLLALAGLVAITPASGFVGPMGAIAIGAASGVICFYAATKVKRALGYDDALDAFGVHAVGGIVGALLTGVFVSAALGGVVGPLLVVTASAATTAQGVFALAAGLVVIVAVIVLLDLKVTCMAEECSPEAQAYAIQAQREIERTEIEEEPVAVGGAEVESLGPLGHQAVPVHVAVQLGRHLGQEAEQGVTEIIKR